MAQIPEPIEQETEQSIKGIHWGKYTFNEKNFELAYEDKNIFKIDYKAIVNASCLQKTEVNLELNIDDLREAYPNFPDTKTRL